MGLLLAMAQNDGQPPMIKTYGYRQLVSQDKLILVQIFTDLKTGEHLRTTVSQRMWPFLDWLPATEVERVV